MNATKYQWIWRVAYWILPLGDSSNPTTVPMQAPLLKVYDQECLKYPTMPAAAALLQLLSSACTAIPFALKARACIEIKPSNHNKPVPSNT
jgi:hypothetical protein